MALAVPVAFAACQDQDFNSTPENVADGQFVKLEKGFALVGTTESEAATKGQWESTTAGIKFYWRPNLTKVANTYTPDEIGLAWTGVCLDKDGKQTAGSLLSVADGRVFTNYKFSHFGWKKVGTEPEIDECEGIYKESTYQPVNGYEDTKNTGNKLTEAFSTTTGEITYTANTKEIEGWPGYTTTKGEVDGSEGLFNTTNSTVYAGQYIVYAPYDKSNTSNYIIATSPENVKVSGFVNKDDDRAKTLNEYTNEIFKYGLTTITEGGTKTAKFATNNLTGYVGLKLQAKTGETSKIKKVILYDPASKYLLTKVGLSSRGIVNDKGGTDLYLGDDAVKREYAETITADIATPAAVKNANAAAGQQFSYITIPVLPTETAIPDLQVILINSENKAFIVSQKNITIERNAYATGNWIEIKNIDFTNAPLIATDETAMMSAITAVIGTNKAGSVRLLGNITLSQSQDFTGATSAAVVTIEGGKIIVPDADGTEAIKLAIGSNFVVNSNIDVLQSCCKDMGGALQINGNNSVLGGTVNIGKNEDVEDDAHEATLTFGATAGRKSQLTGSINNYGIATILKSTSGVSHELDVKGGTINNYDRFTIETTGADDNNDAKLFVETGALNNAKGAEMTVAGVLAVGNSATATNNGTVVDKISSQVTGNIMTLGVAPGKYISEVDDPADRFEAALYRRPTTTVRFVDTQANEYNLNKLNDSRLKSSIETYEVNATAKVTLNSTAEVEATTVTMKNLVVKSELEVVNIKENVTVGTGSAQRKFDAYLNLNVTEALDVQAKLTFADVKDNTKTVLTAKNMTVYADASVAISKYMRSEIENLTVNAKGSGSAAGAITFNFSSQMFISSKIAIAGTADILQATGSGTNVAGDVWLLTGATSTGEGNWKHGIPTPWN